jgi:FAD/FMN-containing dehydrogenase
MIEPQFLQRIRSAIGPHGVIDAPREIEPFLTDFRHLYRGRAPLVLQPADVAEVSTILALCNDAGVGVVPHGGNTGYCGGSVPDQSGDQLVVSLARLNKIRAVEPSSYSMTVEAGCVLANVQQAALAAERYFPLSLGAEGSCQIGGNLATNAGGTAVLRYGMARDLVLGLEVVLADGRVLDMLRSLRKDNTGYDLKSLFIGAEGTLGVITAATLKLFPGVAVRATAYLGIASLAAAGELLAVLRAASADRLTACEVMCRSALELVAAHIPGAADVFEHSCPWYLLVEVQSASPTEDLDSLLEEALEAAMQRGLLLDAIVAKSGAQRAALWRLRESIPEAMAIEGAQIKHDVSVPLAAIPDFAAEAAAWIGERMPQARLVPFGHIGDGNLHFNVSQPVSASAAEFLQRAGEIERGVYDIVRRYGGSFSAEHGIGQYKLTELQRYRTPTELDVMRQLKRALDPRGILNPGKVLPGKVL